jgi:DNA-binding MarR family transcriptional regulator
VNAEDGATANLLGALALVVADRTQQEVAEASDQTGAAPAALSALGQFLDGASLERISEVLGVTHSGAVRLVDRLAGAGLVARGPGPDARTRSVALTTGGQRAAAGVTGARIDYLHRLIGALTASERRALQDILGKLLAAVVDTKDGGPWICRLCDLHRCGRDQGRCPTANAAALKYRRESTGS